MAVLKFVLPAIGKGKLEKREEKQFSEFMDQFVFPMESSAFESWLPSAKTALVPPQGDLPGTVPDHFKATIASAIEMLKKTIKKSGDPVA